MTPDSNQVVQPASPKLIQDDKLSNRTQLPTLSAIFSGLIIAFLIYAFFSGLSVQFYASFLFLFYGFTNSMWISVVMLGIFQTILMIPFRIIRVVKSNNIKEFQQNVRKANVSQNDQLLRKRFRQGNPTLLFYSVDFVMQLVSYISIGRLFLRNFYVNAIDPNLLYKFVKYPTYPLESRFFKIPYPVITKSLDLGMKWVVGAWLVIAVIYVVVAIVRRNVLKNKGKEAVKTMFGKKTSFLTNTSFILILLAVWFVVRHLPAGLSIKIFSGDISIPNRSFNTLTAWATFITLLWHSIPVIVRKGRLAIELKIPRKIIDKTQTEMFKDALMTAGLVGIAAFFITNRIPSAFELSIFTLEIISLLSPLTLDKAVLKGIQVKKDALTQKDLPDEMTTEIENEPSSDKVPGGEMDELESIS